MKRLAGLAVLSVAICILGVPGVIASPSSSSQTYLPYVVNPPPTPTPTPPGGALAWAMRSPVPYWIYPVMGGAVINGQIYVVGPYSVQDYGDGGIHAVTYDPRTDAWTVRSGSGHGAGCCAPATATGATNGKMYVIAATPGTSPMTMEYNPASDSWATRAPIPGPTNYSYFGWVGASNGKLYAVGGSTWTSRALTLLLAYDPSNDSWTNRAAMPVAIGSPSVAATTDGRIYAFGQGIGEVYNTATDSWSTISPKAIVSYGMGAAQAGDGKIYLVGGPPGSLGIPWNIVDVYDPTTDS